VLICGLFFLLFSVGCDQKPPGAAVLPSPGEQRLVSLSPAIPIIARDLGVADRFVGRDSYDMVLPISLPVCGDLRNVDYERLLRANPTHILTQYGALERPRRLMELAAQRGWTVQDFPLLTLADIRATTQAIATLTGTEARGRDLLRQMDQAWAKRPNAGRARRILLLEAVQPPAAVGPGSWHHELLEQLGGLPAIQTGSQYMALDFEDLLHLAPDGIIYFKPRIPGSEGQDLVRGPEALTALAGIARLDLPAIKRGHILVITDPLCLTPSTAMIKTARDMGDALEEWAK
jgi:ABC-type Fe3+-hydroxamate transport system substrate-binding protein